MRRVYRHAQRLRPRQGRGEPSRRERLPHPALRVRGDARSHRGGPRDQARRPPPRAKGPRARARLPVRLLHPRLRHVHVRPPQIQKDQTDRTRDRGSTGR